MSWSIRAASKREAVDKFIEQKSFSHNSATAKEILSALQDAVETFPDIGTIVIDCDGHIDPVYGGNLKLEIKTY